MKFFSSLLGCLLFNILTAINAHSGSLKPQQPNIIFILTDDQGWADAQFAGHPYVKTPNIDRLAREGTVFKQFYVNSPVCSPSRASFLTSHFPARLKLHGHLGDEQLNAKRFMANWLDPNLTTVADIFENAGYATAHFGKWHLGGIAGAPPPSEYGFDISKTESSTGEKLDQGPKDGYFRARSTQIIVDEVIQFISEQKNRPFYVNMWTLLPHGTLKPTPEQLGVYADLAPQADHPAFGKWGKNYLAKAPDLRSQMQVFCASLTDLDTQIGRLVDALDKMGIANETLIILSSDNGPEDYRIQSGASGGVGSTGPLRGRKRSIYEGGVRTLCIVRWPGKVPAGKVDDTTVLSAVDILPTLASITGQKIPDSLQTDGEDMTEALVGSGPLRRSKPLFWEWLDKVVGPEDGFEPPKLAIRDGDWKLYVDHDGSNPQLYNIPTDQSELNNVAEMNEETVLRLKTKVIEWAKSLPANPSRKFN